MGKDRFLRITSAARRARNLEGDNQPVIESLRRVRGDLSAPLAHHRKATEAPRQMANGDQRYETGAKRPHEFRLLGYDFDTKFACGGFWPAGTVSPLCSDPNLQAMNPSSTETGILSQREHEERTLTPPLNRMR